MTFDGLVSRVLTKTYSRSVSERDVHDIVYAAIVELGLRMDEATGALEVAEVKGGVRIPGDNWRESIAVARAESRRGKR